MYYRLPVPGITNLFACTDEATSGDGGRRPVQCVLGAGAHHFQAAVSGCFPSGDRSKFRPMKTQILGTEGSKWVVWGESVQEGVRTADHRSGDRQGRPDLRVRAVENHDETGGSH